MSESLQVFIGGIQKFSNDRDFAKFIEKTIPNYDDIVTGLYKKKASSSVIIRLKNEDAKIFFLDIMAGKMYKNRWLKIKDQEVPVPNKAFASMKRLLRTKECKVTERTEEELKEEMGKDLKDKLIPYHNVPYEEQIRLKSEFLKDIFYKYVARIEKEVETKNEAALPNWLTLYWNSLKDQTAPNESEADPQKVVEIQDDAEEAKDTEEVKEIEELKGVTPSSREKRLPCSFEGILPCDEEYRKGYRNKIEFTIGRNYDDNQLCVGFLKGNANKGLLYVDYPKDLPHISDYAADCAEKLQTLLREYDEKYALNEYNCITHAGCWRMFIYKESKRTNEKLISVVLSRNIMTEEQMEEFKKALLETFNDPKIVSISLIESDTLSGGYDYSDKITYLSKKTYSEEVNGFKFSVSPLAFFQVNTHVFEKILNTIKEWGQFDP